MKKCPSIMLNDSLMYVSARDVTDHAFMNRHDQMILEFINNVFCNITRDEFEQRLSITFIPDVYEKFKQNEFKMLIVEEGYEVYIGTANELSKAYDEIDDPLSCKIVTYDELFNDEELICQMVHFVFR